VNTNELATVPKWKEVTTNITKLLAIPSHFFTAAPNYRYTDVLRKGHSCLCTVFTHACYRCPGIHPCVGAPGLPAFVVYIMAMYQSTISANGKDLVIHLIGASDDDEARGRWQYLTEMLTALQVAPKGRIHIVMVGPHILTGREPCGTCTAFPAADDAPLVVECSRTLYQDWLHSNQNARKPDVALLMNCGIGGEVQDFLPTITYLRDANIFTVVSNYWYEPVKTLSQFFISPTVTAQRYLWKPAGNQNEMWENEDALRLMGVHFIAKYQRNPFPMLFNHVEVK